MQTINLLKRFSAVGSYYPHMKRDFTSSSILMIIISGINVLPPFFLSSSVNAITSSMLISSEFYLFVTLFGLTWTASHVLEWVKNIASAAFLVKTEAAMHNSLFKKIVYAKKSILLDISSGQIIEEISRGRTALVSLIHTFFWGLFPLIVQIFFSYFFILKSVGFLFSLFFLLVYLSFF